MNDVQGIDPSAWQNIAHVIQISELPILLLEPPTFTIIAASAAAARLMCPGGDKPAGRRLVDFFGGDDSGGLELISQGKVRAYETRRILHATGEPVSIWVRTVANGRARCAAAVLQAQPFGPTVPRTRPTAGRVLALGAVREDLMIGSFITEAPGLAEIAGFDTTKLVGASLLQLIEPADVCRLLELTASDPTASADSAGGRIVRVRMRRGRYEPCDVLLAPHQPHQGYAFTVVDVGESLPTAEFDLRRGVELLASEANSAGGDSSSEDKEKLLGKLSQREREVVTELLNGYRAPAIASKLYLTPGTVRNHLSTAFRKLAVGNQQELINLLRRAGPAGS